MSRAERRDKNDREVIEKLDAAGVPILYPGRPRLTAESIEDGQVRDLGYRHRRWRLLAKPCASSAAIIANHATQFVAEHRPQNLVHIRIRPPCGPVDVTSYAATHRTWQPAVSRAIEYLESQEWMHGLHLTVHPRRCNNNSQIDLHFHLIAQLELEHLPRVAKYLRERLRHVWISAEHTHKKRNFIRDAAYAERGINPSLAAMSPELLAAFYEQTQNLRFSFPRGAFRAFRAELRERAAKRRKEKKKKRRKTPRHAPHPEAAQLGPRTIAVAPVWHGRERLTSRIIMTYESAPTHFLLKDSPHPENRIPAQTLIPASHSILLRQRPAHPINLLLSKGATMLMRKVLSPKAIQSWDTLVASGIKCHAVIWPLEEPASL